MKLTDSGESRVRGYLFVFERSLRTFLPRDVASDAVREVESHIRDVVAQSDGAPNERDAVERILDELGPPLRVAQAYSLELVMDEAATTGRVAAVLRSLFQVAATGARAFAATLALFVGYTTGAALMAVAMLKLVFPANVGLWTRGGIPRSFGAQFPRPEGLDLAGGYWIIPIALLIGIGILVATHVAARRWLGWARLHVLPQSFRTAAR
jgi:uncharacterized membrane protein